MHVLGDAHDVSVQQGDVVHVAEGGLEHHRTRSMPNTGTNQVLGQERRALEWVGAHRMLTAENKKDL